MTFFSRIPIRTKMALVMTVILAVISAAIFLYFPGRLAQQALGAVTQKAAALAEMTAFSAAPGLAADERTAVAGALTGVRRNPDLAFIIVKDRRGESYASFNELIAQQSQAAVARLEPIGAESAIYPHRPDHRIGELKGGYSNDGKLFVASTPILYQGKKVGTLVLGFDVRHVRDDLDRGRATTLLVTLLAFGLAVAAVFALSTLITGPLSRISRTAESIAAGDLSRRAEVGAGDEVGQLARSFNVMVDGLTTARDELASLNRNLEQRVEERTREAMEQIEERRRAEERYRLLFERNLAGAYVARENLQVVSCNDACAQMFGYQTREEFMKESGIIRYTSSRDRDSVLRRLHADGIVTNEEVQLQTRDGTLMWALENVRLVLEPDGQVALEGILLDINDRKCAEEEIAYRAYHDPLTDLPNRALFRDRLTVAIAHSERQQRCLAVLFLDLDELKMVNDTFGHAVGDDLLKLVAHRLSEMMRRGDTVARVGGDEFLVLLPDIHGESDATMLAQKMLDELAKPMLVHGEELHLTTSVGVAIYPVDGLDADALIRAADGAMYGIKERGGNRFQLAGRATRTALGRMSLENELRAALDRDEFVVYFQPQIDLTTAELTGFEALVRWHNAEDSIVEPGTFIPVAEHSGFINALGEVVLRKTCDQYASWLKAGFSMPRVGVNVSARQFYKRDFVGVLQRIIEGCGMPPENLELEITETVAMQKTEHGLRMVRRLREMGITIAIDDFGTGQASFSYLKRFPVDTVKIDRSFVREIATQPNESIVMAILLIAKQLKLRTVAEGVETNTQRDFLRNNGCDSMQGYLISRPVPPVTFESLFLSPDLSPLDLQAIVGVGEGSKVKN